MEWLLQLLFPIRCSACARYDAAGLCAGCRQGIPESPIPFMLPSIERGFSLGPHAWPLREAVAALKFRHVRVVARVLGEMLADRLAAARWPVELIVPVPMARS